MFLLMSTVDNDNVNNDNNFECKARKTCIIFQWDRKIASEQIEEIIWWSRRKQNNIMRQIQNKANSPAESICGGLL